MASVVGIVVASKKVTLVEGEANGDGSVTLIKDETLNLETGERSHALRQMHQRIYDRLSEGVDKAVVKASSGGQYAAKTSVLHAAELRGVVIAAIPAAVQTVETHSKSVSRARSKKIGDYLQDDNFFEENFSGINLRKTSREAAFLLFNEETE